MPELRKNVGHTRQLVDYNNVIAGLNDYGLFCIPVGLMSVIRILLAERGLWRTTYVIERIDGGYYIPTSEEFLPIDEKISEFLGGGDMTCDIVSALNDIREAIDRQSASCGGGGAGGTGATGSPPVDFEDTGENYPNGFSGRPQFDAFKCNMAEFIMRNIEVDLQTMVNLQVSEISIAGLIASLVTPIPLDDVAMMVVTLLTVVGEAYIDAVLTELEEAIEDFRDDIRCLLYNAISAEDAKNSIAGFISDNVGDAAFAVFGLFVGYDNLNRLFVKSSVPADFAVDCSGCGGSCGDLYGQHSNVDATFYDGNYWMFISSQQFGGSDSCEFQVENLSFSGFSPVAGFQYQPPGGNLTQINEDLNTYPMEGVCMVAFQSACATPFTFSVNIIECE